MTSVSSWVPGAAGSGYDVDHLPYAATDQGLVVRIGDRALDLAGAARALRPDLVTLVEAPRLDPLLAAGPDAWADVRRWVGDLLTDPAYADRVTLVPVDGLALRLPFTVADYVDCYASEVHATTVSRILRPDAERPLQPSWKRLPVSYTGRAGSVVVSGTPVRRPRGQVGDGTYAPTARLDLEAEVGFVVGGSVPLGETVSPADLDRLVFGVVGLDDWSARDIQAFEYVPLGPHLGKSFATSVSAWVTPLAALEAARVPLPAQDPPPLPHLAVAGPAAYDLAVEVEVNGSVVSRPGYRDMYWSPGQMLAHLVSNGAGLRPGDLFASGTVSSAGQPGCLLELTWGGQRPFSTAAGERTYLEDGDEVVLRYSAPGALDRITLGDVRGRILPAHEE